jgi:hypothetical protein
VDEINQIRRGEAVKIKKGEKMRKIVKWASRMQRKEKEEMKIKRRQNEQP